MGAFLGSLLAKLLEPLIKTVVEAAIEQIRLAAIQIQIQAVERNQADIKKAFDLWAQAKTTEEKDQALKSIASSWNTR